MATKIPIECVDCEYRNKVKALNHSNARYKAVFKQKAYICQKLRMELRSRKNHLLQMQKKIYMLIKDTDKSLSKYRW